jgi:hypothetical protein
MNCNTLLQPIYSWDTMLSRPQAAGCLSVVAVMGEGGECFHPCFPSAEGEEGDRGAGDDTRFISASLLRIFNPPFTTGTLPGNSCRPPGFSATRGNGPFISFPSSSVSGLTSVSRPSSSGVDELAVLLSRRPLDAGLAYSAVDRDLVADISAAENGTDESGVESWRAEGELKTGPSRMATSGDGGSLLAAAAKPAPSHFLR